MWVKYVGKDPQLSTDYNGKRYAFHRNKPVEITPEIYQAIILSGHISAVEVVPCDAPVLGASIGEIPKKESIVEKSKSKKGKKKKK